MAKKKKPDTQPEEKEAEVFDDIQIVEATLSPDPARIQRGLGALHEAFKRYKVSNDQAMAELKGTLDSIARRQRGGQ